MKRKLSIIGIIVGIYFILFGILSISGALGSATAFGGSSPYDSGYASFGGDYYTYSVNNAAEAASAANAAASNLRHISELLCNVCGVFLIGLGTATICGFGIVLCSVNNEKKQVTECVTCEGAEISPEGSAEQQENGEAPMVECSDESTVAYEEPNE